MAFFKALEERDLIIDKETMKLIENTKMDLAMLKNLDKKKEMIFQQDDEFLERMRNGDHNNHQNQNFSNNFHTNED